MLGKARHHLPILRHWRGTEQSSKFSVYHSTGSPGSDEDASPKSLPGQEVFVEFRGEFVEEVLKRVGRGCHTKV